MLIVLNYKENMIVFNKNLKKFNYYYNRNKKN